MRANPHDARAPYYLGNLFYDRRRHAEAIRLWERSAKLNPDFSIVWRNLGIGYFNISKQPAKARAAYERAFRANPRDARLLFERDQLWKRLGEKPAKRLRELEKYAALVRQRDDLTVELCALSIRPAATSKRCNSWPNAGFSRGKAAKAGRWASTSARSLRSDAQALAQQDFPLRRQAILRTRSLAPENLGEARHLLANQSDIHYWLGVALDLLGEQKRRAQHWLAAANFKGDFQEMSVRAFQRNDLLLGAVHCEKLGRKRRRKNFCATCWPTRKSVAKVAGQN